MRVSLLKVLAIWLLCLIGAVGITSAAIPSAPSFASNYTQVWAQDFTTMSTLSVSAYGPCGAGGTTWMAHKPKGGDWFTFIDPAGNFDPFGIGNGYLTIRVQNNGSSNNGFGGFTGGLLSSVDNNGHGFSQQYGYFECSMQTPGGPNTWPAFWLLSTGNLPNNNVNVAEIDVTESYGNCGTGPGQIPAGNPNLSISTWDEWMVNPPSTYGQNSIQVAGLSTGFHTYGVDIEPTGINWYLDRQLFWSSPIYPEAQQPMLILLNLALGGGNYNNATGTGYDWSLTQNPSDLKVQYVAVWASPYSPNYSNTVPSAPTGLTATPGYSQVSLKWTASTGAGTYNVYRGTTAGNENASPVATGIYSTSYTDTGLVNGTTYYYVVKAVNSVGTSTQSSEVSAMSGAGVITWGAGQNMVGDTDVKTNGTLFDAASFYGSAVTVNGTTFNPIVNGTDGKISINTPNGSVGAYGTAFTTASPSSLSYSNLTSILGFGYYQNGTVTISNLVVGNSYQIQAWSYYTGAAGSANTSFTGYAPVNLNTLQGQYAVGTFTASSTIQTFNYNFGVSYGVINAVAVRNITGSGGSGGSAPSAPTGLTATAGNAQVGLTWTTSSGATSYNIYRGTSTNSESATAIATATASSYTDTGLTNNTTYYYKVAAVNSYGTSTYSSEVNATPTAGTTTSSSQITWGTAQSMVGNTDVSAVGNAFDAATFHSANVTVNGVTFNTLGSSNTDGKISIYAPNGVGPYTTAFTTSSPSSAAYSQLTDTLGFGYYASGTVTISGLTSGHTYQVQAWSYWTGAGSGESTSFTAGNTVTLNTAIGQYVIGTFTAAATTQTFTYGATGHCIINAVSVRDTSVSVPAAPTGLTATAGNAQVSLSWTGNAQATSYNVYRGTSTNSETLLKQGLSTTSYTDTGLTNNTTYYYKVTAVNTSGASGYSSEVSATPSAPLSAQITWGTAQYMLGVNDVSTTGTAFDAATFYGTAEIVNGVTFNPLAASGTINGYTGYTDGKISANSPGNTPGAYGGNFASASPSSAAYSAAVSTLGFGYYANGTVNISGLTVGHTYQVQVWSFYPGSPGNCNTTLTGANTVTLDPDSGEYAIGSFTAGSTTLSFNYNYGIQYGLINAISIRDTTN